MTKLPVEIGEIITRDGMIHQGFFFDPPGKRTTAYLWIHGLSSTFYNALRMHRAFLEGCKKRGCGYASFNTRGHDQLAGIRTIDRENPKGYGHKNGGAGFEVFTDSMLDIEAGVLFLQDRGYENIILVGHSTGANKACWYAAHAPNAAVKGVVLSGPMSDRLGLGHGLSRIETAYLRFLIAAGKGDIPIRFPKTFFAATPKRILSLLSPGSEEDVFDYGGPEPILKTFASINIPTLVLIGGMDEYADRPVSEIRRAFDTHSSAKRYKSRSIPGADHAFFAHEREFVRDVFSFFGQGNS